MGGGGGGNGQPLFVSQNIDARFYVVYRVHILGAAWLCTYWDQHGCAHTGSSMAVQI